ncbi:MAG: amidohydrolase family protein [Opitutales bacterium]|nr:amidohydrolase family protein [Opitutales bacterium]
MILDAHTHLFPPAAAADPVVWANERGESHWRDLVVPPDGASRQGWATPEEMIAAMDQAGVTKAIVQGWYWENPDTVAEVNDWTLATLAPYRQRLIPFAAINPAKTRPADLLAEAEKRYEEGFRGFGEISPAAQGFSLTDEAWVALAEWAQKREFPLCLHVNEPVAHPRLGWQPESLQDYLDFALAFPRLPIILAHLGGLLPIFAANPRVRWQICQTRLLFDTAALPLLYNARIFAALPARSILPRILFGSDFPLLLGHPPEVEPSWQPSLQYLAKAPLSEEQKTNLLGTNARHHLPSLFSV